MIGYGAEDTYCNKWRFRGAREAAESTAVRRVPPANYFGPGMVFPKVRHFGVHKGGWYLSSP